MPIEKKEEIVISLPPEYVSLLREYAFFEGIRTPNTAAAEIICEALDEWRDGR